MIPHLAITKLAAKEQDVQHTFQCCERIAYLIELKYHYRHVYGQYTGPEINGIYTHHWNITPNGTIIDATANQFGDKLPVHIVYDYDIRHKWYIEIPKRPEDPN
jgi:hypothetical protein